MSKYVYTFIRRDISLAQQIVQSCHSALEAGAQFLGEHQPNLVLIGVKNEKELLKIKLYLDNCGINHSMFYEPDNEMGHSSITTEPLCIVRKQFMRGFKLWREHE